MAEYYAFDAFIGDQTVLAPVLVCPVRVLWRGYQAYCHRWGFELAEAGEFMEWLRGVEGLAIKEGGKGRLRRCAVGIGLLPYEKVA